MTRWVRHRLLTLRFRDHMRKRAEFIAVFGHDPFEPAATFHILPEDWSVTAELEKPN